MKRFISSAAFFLVASAVSGSAAWAYDSTIFLPKKGGEWKNVQVELIFEQPRTREGQQKLGELRRLLAGSFRPMQGGDVGPYLAKCTALLNEWKEKDLEGANFKVECWSVAMWDGDNPKFFYTSADTPGEFLKMVDQWVVRHRERLDRPRSKPSLYFPRPNLFT